MGEPTPKELAEAIKRNGNEFYKEGNYEQASSCYSKAIELDCTNKTFWSNRSAARYKSGDIEGAMQDAEECIRIDSKYVKGYIRKGEALDAMGKYEQCQNVYAEGIFNVQEVSERKHLERLQDQVRIKIQQKAEEEDQVSMKLDTRDICKLMDELEVDLQTKAGWGWAYDNKQSILDIWNRNPQGGAGSLLSSEFLKGGKRIVTEIFSESIGGEGTMYKAWTVAEFRSFWNDLFDEKAPPEMRPYLMPNMVYARTFRCTNRALLHYGGGPSLEREFRIGATITPEAVLAVITTNLARRDDSMVLLGFKSFHGPRSSLGMSLIIDCLPLLRCASCKSIASKEVIPACTLCKTTFYCNRNCQAADWKRHKKQCMGNK